VPSGITQKWLAEILALIMHDLRNIVTFLHNKWRFDQLHCQTGLEMPFNVT
jgi:hypothetical protein